MTSRYLVDFLRHNDFHTEINAIVSNQDFNDYTCTLLKIKVREMVQHAYKSFIEQSKAMDSNEYISRYKYFLLINSCSMTDSICSEAIQVLYGECLC